MLSSDVIYTEACNWLRMVNSICWQMAALFIPITLGSFTYAIKFPIHKYWVGTGSIITWLMFSYVFYKYVCSANRCREALKDIESVDKVPLVQRIYTNQWETKFARHDPRNVLLGSCFIIIVAWVAIFVLI